MRATACCCSHQRWSITRLACGVSCDGFAGAVCRGGQCSVLFVFTRHLYWQRSPALYMHSCCLGFGYIIRVGAELSPMLCDHVEPRLNAQVVPRSWLVHSAFATRVSRRRLLLALATVALKSGCGHRGSQEDILAASFWSFLAINFPTLTAGRGCDVIGQHLQNRLAVRRRLLAARCCWCRITGIGYCGFSDRS